VQTEINYLKQVESTLAQLEHYEQVTDLFALREIRDELVQQKYFETAESQNRATNGKEIPIESSPYRYQSPSGLEIVIGRNNRQNDWLTFRLAGDYDLWFHAQEIPGSHVLLRLQPGKVPEDTDLQLTADLAAYFSRGRQSEQVPVVCTEPRYVFKPRGTQPGMVVYQKERIYWGHPHQGEQFIATNLSEKTSIVGMR
jgi:predicted ribosome quality control (RQC) complex YloA/Tae2 family protein